MMAIKSTMTDAVIAAALEMECSAPAIINVKVASVKTEDV